jgi:hypothetical protein
MEPKNLNVTVNEGEAFYCHELSINYNPMQFVLDFKSVTPRVDLRSKDMPSISIKHNVVLLDPYHAKQTVELLSKVLADFEKDFGKITKPKALEAMEKKAAKEGKELKNLPPTLSPTYFG